MKFDGKIDLATGMGATSRIWKNKKWKWSDFVNRLKNPQHTNESLKEFISSTKEEQTKIKDVGGYVGGYLRAGRRKPTHVIHRQLLTLDIDFADGFFWDEFQMQFENAAVLHGTHKHCPTSPRLRLLMPLSREVSPDEYVAVARQVAGSIGIEVFDKTTFETNRLMFWQSTPRDQEYYFEFQDGEWLDVDSILDSYSDWKDSSLWPTADRQFQEVKDASNKQEDPETKKGIVGVFCRTYSISESIEKFLKDKYVEVSEDRYTYTEGTTAGGLTLYDNKFAYSHHGTDPCGGKLCNSFDLVRIHMYGHLDSGAKTKNEKLKSFKAMEDFARNDSLVKKNIAIDSFAEAKYDFIEPIEELLEKNEENLEWATELEVDAKGRYLSTATNLNIIFANDPRLKKIFKQNDFDGKRYVFADLPWRKINSPEAVKNVDYSGVRNYIETIYGIAGNLKIDDSLALEFEKNAFHPIKEYFSELKWDGKKRIDTLLQDYLGASDNIYTQEAARKTLCAAVARIFKPGIKFDLVLTLVGEQGTGKSTLVKKLGGRWFSDTFMTVSGKDAFEQLQGAWLMEMAELSGLRKAEVEAVKHYISKQEDTFRPAYARTAETFKRQCVFIGTTNKKDFLNDPSGNRRFMPIDIKKRRAKKNIFNIKQKEVDQIWAEALELYNSGEKLYLSDEAEGIAQVEQRGHSEIDERVGLVQQYLDTKLPENWDSLNMFDRRNIVSGDELAPKYKDGEPKNFVCVAEIWCECLGKDKKDMDRYKTREINDIMRGLEGWEQSNSTKNFGIYGKQKYYKRLKPLPQTKKCPKDRIRTFTFKADKDMDAIDLISLIPGNEVVTTKIVEDDLGLDEVYATLALRNITKSQLLEKMESLRGCATMQKTLVVKGG